MPSAPPKELSPASLSWFLSFCERSVFFEKEAIAIAVLQFTTVGWGPWECLGATASPLEPLGAPGIPWEIRIPPGWSEKLSNRALPLKIGFSRPGIPRNRFILKFCVGWYFQNRFSSEICLRSTTFDLFGRLLDYWFLAVFDFSWDHMNGRL